MLFTIEPLLFQDERRHTIVEQREAGVMSSVVTIPRICIRATTSVATGTELG